MKAEGLKDTHELQSYFIKRIEKHLNARGKRLIGWDEILEGGLAPNASVMSWRGISGGIAAAKAGHDVVMSPTSHCYFDYPYSSISTEAVYGYEPIPSELSEEEAKRVLGAQGNVWTEWMDTSRKVEQMAFPRAVALSEALWSPKEGRSWGEFQVRMRHALARLDALDVHYDMPAPVATLDAAIFRNTATVSFELPDVPGSQIRYTTDGSVPGSKSSLYKGPFEVSESTEVRAATIRGSNASNPIRVSFVKQEHAPRRENGIVATLFVGKFATVAEMVKTRSTRVAKVTNLDLGMNDLSGVDPSYGITFQGTLNITVPGVYTFTTTSDDGSVLQVGGATVVDNDGLHGRASKSGRVMLPAGIHRFVLHYFEAGGAEFLEVTVKSPDGKLGPLDASWFTSE